MIKVACAGFPVGRKQYESKLQTVELDQMFDKFPRQDTLEKWRAEAPQHFDFIVCASKLITHPPKARANKSRPGSNGVGMLQDSAIVRQAYQQTLQAAETLRARLVLFQLPSTFGPSPDNIRRVQQFFGKSGRGHILFAWEPAVTWPTKLVDDLSEAYRLMPVMNPLGRAKPTKNSPMRFYRLGAHGRTSGIMRFTDEELRTVKNLCDTPLCYVVFNNGPTAFSEAVNFAAKCS
jgi:uncharacterized protein YecE (DUF72 family)